MRRCKCKCMCLCNEHTMMGTIRRMEFTLFQVRIQPYCDETERVSKSRYGVCREGHV